MSTISSTPHYNGVQWHKRCGKWHAKARKGKRQISLGYFRDAELAAWAADFARYIIHGSNPAYWPSQTGRPNGPPRNRPDYPRSLILERIAAHSGLDGDTIASHLAEYDRGSTNQSCGQLKRS